MSPYEWMQIYSHVKILCNTNGQSQYTGNILVEHYKRDNWPYEMIIFRLATLESELNNPVGVSQGMSASMKPYPGPCTALVIKNGEVLSIVREALENYAHRFSNLTITSYSSNTNPIELSDARDDYWDVRNQNIIDLERLGINLQIQAPMSLAQSHYTPAPDYSRELSQPSCHTNDTRPAVLPGLSAPADNSNHPSRIHTLNYSSFEIDQNLLPSYNEVAHETEYGQQWISSNCHNATNV
ncbi:hypothetical protein BB561_002201 [Smittium simulii]|uniref:Uncharacterized protein n=1 Tax=Smittium simulii TaxID=133385 RepID=A0A2T9YRB0_9FUNG|nr:hypothetical protein BB561_002201 [Smittium simulii]